MWCSEGPSLTANKAEWEQWLTTLKSMKRNDGEVNFAIRRAEQMITLLSTNENAVKRMFSSN